MYSNSDNIIVFFDIPEGFTLYGVILTKYL